MELFDLKAVRIFHKAYPTKRWNTVPNLFLQLLHNIQTAPNEVSNEVVSRQSACREQCLVLHATVISVEGEFAVEQGGSVSGATDTNR